MWQAHPRTKGSAGYPDAVREQPHFLSDRFLGGSYQSLPVDQSEKRLCEKRCLGLMDEMNNWTGSKYLIAEGDTYMKWPDDETFPQLVVNYVKLDRVPKFDEDWSPILHAMRAGDFYVSSGEVLCATGTSRAQARAARTRRKSSGRSPWNSWSWCGETATPFTRRLFPLPISRRSDPRNSRSRLMPRARSGSVSPPGIQRETGPSRSRYT